MSQTQTNKINITEVMNEMIESGMPSGHSLVFGERVRWLFREFGVEKVMTTKNDFMKYAIDNLALKPFYETLSNSDFSDITEVTDEIFDEQTSIYNYYLVMHIWISILTEEPKHNRTDQR
jgi:hypothetical protein